MTKAGRLFENALKEAHLELKPDSEIRLKVRGKGRHLKLVIAGNAPSDFEASILARSKRSETTAKIYRPKVSQGERIRILRKAAGLTIEKLALRAGLSKGSLSSIENGVRPIGLQVLKRIAAGLGVAVAVLLAD